MWWRWRRCSRRCPFGGAVSFTATGPTVAPRRPGRSGRGVLTCVITDVPVRPGRRTHRHRDASCGTLCCVTAQATAPSTAHATAPVRPGDGACSAVTAALCAAAVLVDLQVPAAHRRALELEPAWAACLAALVMAWAGATVLADDPRHLVGWLLSGFGAVVGPRRLRLRVARPRDVRREPTLPGASLAFVGLPAARRRPAPAAAPAPRPLPARPAARGPVARRRGRRARGHRPAARRPPHGAGPRRAGGRG